jgi:ribonuclease G
MCQGKRNASINSTPVLEKARHRHGNDGAEATVPGESVTSSDHIILINSRSYETRVALLERRRLVEIFVERRRERGVAGNIYRGRVTRVLPGMQAAFVDIGLEKSAFLHGSDLFDPVEPELLSTDAQLEADDGFLHKPEPEELIPIEERLKTGQEIVVQVAKEPIGSKGARITSMISLPGRHLVFVPAAQGIGVSRRIENEEERDRLRDLVRAERPETGGFIIRTACEGLTKREIQSDIRFLVRWWKRIMLKSKQTGAPTMLYYDMDVALRAIRDHLTAETQRVLVDDGRDHQRVLEFVNTVAPRLASRIELYEEKEPMFDRLGIEAQIAKALDRKVWLKSGGHVVIDETEALTVIDVNTGRFVGKTSQAETVLRTNLEAARTVVEQLRLRNIGGLIVIDFIDMEDARHREEVVQALNNALRRDRGRPRVLAMSELGLVEMTRRRTRESLAQLLCSPCPNCERRGRVRSVATVVHDVLREVERVAWRNSAARRLSVTTSAAVSRFLQDHEARHLQMQEERFGLQIVVQANDDWPDSRFETVCEEAEP